MNDDTTHQPPPSTSVTVGIASALLVVGVVLVFWSPGWKGIHRLDPRIPPGAFGAVIGVYFLFAGAGLIAIPQMMKGAAKLMEFAPDPDADRTKWAPRLVGLLEAVLYPTSLLAGHGAFIGVWLALKTAGSWKRWEKETYEGRARFQIFLLGNGLSILFGAATYAAIRAYFLAGG